MYKRNKSTAGPKSPKRKTLSTRKIPPDIRKHIKGMVVDISSAHEYSRRIWDAVRPRLGSAVTELGQDRYRLCTPFFEYFLQELHRILDNFQVRDPNPRTNAADILARFLFDAAMTYGTPQNVLASEPTPLWPKDRPVSEAWRLVGMSDVFTPAGGINAVFEDPGAGEKLRVTSAAECQYPRIGLTVTLSKDRSTLPKITIETEGELVCVLMKAMCYSQDASERSTVRNEARRIWTALSKEIGVILGIERPQQGRPSDFRFEKAALLKYDDGLSWRQVAERLCPENHTHARKCQERFRKGVEYLFNELRNRARLLPPVK